MEKNREYNWATFDPLTSRMIQGSKMRGTGGSVAPFPKVSSGGGGK